jgi:hypothetical protein
MSVTPTDVASFKALYLKHFGITLSDDDARKSAEQLLRLFRAVYAGGKTDWIGRQPDEKSTGDTPC